MNNDFDTIVTIHNIDDEDFEFAYNQSEGNPPYTIPAGEVARYPKPLAEHALKHLVDRILTKRGIRTNHETARGEVMNQVVIGSESIRSERKLTDDEKMRQRVEDLNKTATLDSILEKRKLEKDQKPVEEVVTTETPADTTEKFEGLEDEKKEEVVEKVELETKLDEIKKEEKNKVVPMPTKKELLNYAVTQNLVLDEPNKEGKTLREVYEKMKVEDLVRELNYPLEKE